MAHVKFPSIEATARSGTVPLGKAFLHNNLTSCTLVIGSEKDNLFESTTIPKYSMILAGLVIDFSQFIKKTRNSNISAQILNQRALLPPTRSLLKNRRDKPPV